MRVLVACEFSGVVRNAFRNLGHQAYSCDLIPGDDNSPYHIQGDMFKAIKSGVWDLVIAHPPCTYLCISGMHWNKKRPERQEETDKALKFIKKIMNLKVPRLAIENPIGVISTKIRKPDQIVQPWMFGHGETKATCLWLKNLPKLTPTLVVSGREQRMWKLPPTKDRSKLRSITYTGIAEAMAKQWGA
jgi:hypothetical protein